MIFTGEEDVVGVGSDRVPFTVEVRLNLNRKAGVNSQDDLDHSKGPQVDGEERLGALVRNQELMEMEIALKPLGTLKRTGIENTVGKIINQWRQHPGFAPDLINFQFNSMDYARNCIEFTIVMTME